MKLIPNITKLFSKKATQEEDTVEQSYVRLMEAMRRNNVADTSGRYKKSMNELSEEEIIDLNISVNTINKKQTSIINNCQLVIKEISEGRDQKTTNIYYNRFLEWLNKPNNHLSPRKIEDIFSYIIRNYNKTGLVGIIFVFKKAKDVVYLDTFEKIITPKKLHLQTSKDLDLEYIAQIKEEIEPLKLVYSGNYLNFVCEKKGKIYILCPFTNFIEEKGQCISPFAETLPFIEGQNAAIENAKEYYKNNCTPGLIINVNSEDFTSSTKSNTERQRVSQEIMQEKIKNDLEGLSNSGKSKVIFTKNGTVTFERITQAVVSTEIEKMINMCGDKIYASVDGGNRSVFEGLNEYSNNAEIKIEESYKGTIRMAKPLLCSNFDIFFQNLFVNNETQPLRNKFPKQFANIENTYFALDTSGVEILKAREIEEIKELYKANLITNGSAVDNLKSVDDKWNNLNNNSDLYFSQIDNQISYDGKSKV